MGRAAEAQHSDIPRLDACFRVNAATRLVVVTLVDDAWSGSAAVDVVVTALCLQLPDVQLAPNHDRTDPCATRSGALVANCETNPAAKGWTCFGSATGSSGSTRNELRPAERCPMRRPRPRERSLSAGSGAHVDVAVAFDDVGTA
jgi:hypothetical protein